jgi:hypothetical protein
MFLTVHTTAAIAIGAQITNPAGAFLAGLVSHYILDIIPHGDETRWPNVTNGQLAKLALFDHMVLVINLSALLVLKPGFDLTAPMALAILGAVLPDYLMALHRLTTSYPAIFWNRLQKIIDPWERFHHFAHFDIIKYDPPFWAGAVMQAVAMAALWILI